MVGLQFGAVMENMGSLLNGVVNYNSWLPEQKMYYTGTKEFFDKYTKRAVEAKVDPLGYYLAPFGYASGQLVEAAVKAVGSLDQKAIAKYLHEHEMQTIVGPMTFGPDGERKEKCGAAGPVPRHCRQEHRAVPLFGQAGDPVPGETEIRRSRQSVRGRAEVRFASLRAKRSNPEPQTPDWIASSQVLLAMTMLPSPSS